MKWSLFAVLLMGTLSYDAFATVREGGGDSKIMGKLQAMVKEVTAERDTLKIETEKVAAELDKVKKELAKASEEKTAALSAVVAAEGRLNGELAVQRSSADEIRQRLDATTAKLHEVIDKYNALNKAKNEQSNDLAQLQKSQQATVTELTACESKNVKMYQASKDIMAGYRRCQNRGVVDTLLESEPVSQISNVEFETVLQEYEDKLRKQKYAVDATR